ncbi:MAG: hypothetical protein VKL42_03315, partial [Snowella sp.]|nr:hypothetical protein [Snowella sp.]
TAIGGIYSGSTESRKVRESNYGGVDACLNLLFCCLLITFQVVNEKVFGLKPYYLKLLAVSKLIESTIILINSYLY